MSDKNEWGSNLSFVLAMVGSAVGLGNIWRYPYVLYSNGGGAFYIPYIVAILLMGVPFLILEYGVGYNFKSSFPKAIRKIEQIESYTLTEYSSDKANHFKQFLKTRIRSLKSFPYQGESI